VGYASKCVGGAAVSKWRRHRDRFRICREGRDCPPYSSPALVFGSVRFSLSLPTLLLNTIPFQQMRPVSRTCRSFLRFCCGLNQSLFDPRPLRAAWRPKPVRLARRVRVLPQRRAGVSSCRKPASLFTLALDLGSRRLPGSSIPHPKGRPARAGSASGV
jgi:hypothetical protein